MSEPLLTEIRAVKPAAPPALRQRVRALAAEEPAREPFLARLDWRRLVLLVPATVAVALVAGTVIGLTRDDPVGGRADQAVSGGADPATTVESAASERGRVRGAPGASDSAAVPPAPGTLQRYDAELSLRVDDVEELSHATQRAMRIARSLGGDVAAVSYDAAPEGTGSAQLTLRVPVARVTDAVAQLSALGTILAQRYGIQDLQPTVADLSGQISETERRIARLVRQLRSTSLVDEERAELRLQLDEARRNLAELRKLLAGTRAEGALATIDLSLTTEDVQASPEGESRLNDVKDVLAWEAIAALYVAVVLGPLVLLGLLVRLGWRAFRRREEARLLEQS